MRHRLKDSWRRLALRSTLFYTIVAGLWILLSDSLVAAWGIDAEKLQTFKGLGFVLLTAALLYVLLLRHGRERQQAEEELRISEERLQFALEGVNDGLWDWNAVSGAVYFSPHWETMLGYEPGELPRRVETWSERVHPEDRERVIAVLQDHLDGNSELYVTEHRVQAKNGDWVWVLDRGRVVARDPQGRPLRVVGLHTDITERRRQEERLRQAAVVFESTAEGVLITDARGRIIAVNKAFREITGYGEAEVLGRNPSLMQSGRHDPAFYRAMWETLHTTGRWRGEIWNRRRNGEIYPQWLTVSTVRDLTGGVLNYVGVFADITTVKRSQADLEWLAHHDPLTRLPNRLLLDARLTQALDTARRYNRKVAVLFLDLDHFKNVNDSLGHPMGDALLQQTAERLRNCLRSEDTVARLGGDEFVLVLTDLERGEDALVVVEKIIGTLSRPFRLGGRSAYVTTSIGVAVYPEHGADTTALVRNADAAMYRAKAEGRDAYRFYRTEMTAQVLERLDLEAALREALDRRELTVHYQPQVELHSGRLLGAEALLRWHSPRFGTVSPGRFIPLAEETGLILPLGEWVLETACRQLTTWRRAGLNLERIGVNVAGPQFERGDLVGTVERVLAATGLEPQALELEVTETFIMKSSGDALVVLDRLRALGVGLAIDDFGTGYASLSYLKRLPVNKIKIDQGFVRDLPEDANDAAIVRAILAMGRSLGLQLIAEGVETSAQRTFLAALGCEEAQGYLWGRPMAPVEFLQCHGTKPDAMKLKSIL